MKRAFPFPGSCAYEGALQGGVVTAVAAF